MNTKIQSGQSRQVSPTLIDFIFAGMMDIALLTANANQLRFLITYNTETKTFYISTGLIVLSLIIQVLVGMALIFKASRFLSRIIKMLLTLQLNWIKILKINNAAQASIPLFHFEHSVRWKSAANAIRWTKPVTSWSVVCFWLLSSMFSPHHSQQQPLP